MSALSSVDPAQYGATDASNAGLHYVSTSSAGIRRAGEAPAFEYFHPNGRPVTEETILARIRALAIPPAWTDVWICTRPQGHIQATGRDAKRRKQYRYHKAWHEVRHETKYGRLTSFALALPPLRARVDEHLSLPGLPREKVLAAVIGLLEATLIRVGNEEYARANNHYGLTTLRAEHVVVCGSEIRFEFAGKSGVTCDLTIRDRRLARIVKKCQDVPGQELFQYRAGDGEPGTINSTDVNAYLRDATGNEFSAKDFRTWAGTVLAFLALRSLPGAPTKVNVVAAVDVVAARLGNTRSVCRTSYIHPAVIEAYLEGSLADADIQAQPDRQVYDLSDEEVAVLSFLNRRAAERPGELEDALARSVREAKERRRSGRRREGGPLREGLVAAR